jgi:uncharacterized membrane protein
LFERRFWGLLFSLVFACSACRPAPRAKRPLGSYQDIGISDVRDKITLGTSALFIFAPDHAALDRAAGKFRDTDAEIISASLSKEHEARLREAFAQDQRPTAVRPGAGPAPDPVTLTAAHPVR